ncbi:MAG: hypothetical protein LBM73_00300 [Candidatus Nomurabacteria bacterium]|jgi:tRNA threonylcarbamoyladenosine biosynthesis protein TsaB|nr:hypothetical protein [Candidatus Nomurabacteria bacterium]
MILALKTAGEMAEIYVLDEAGKILRRKVWPAGRDLSRDLLGELDNLIKDWTKLDGVIIFRGPGSFTGLRIGIATANAVSYARGIPIVGCRGESWRADGLKRLRNGDSDRIVQPEYGAEPHITLSKNN